MFATIIGGIVATLLAIITYKRTDSEDFYIGQKIYYYVIDKEKKYAGRIVAIITYYREEDTTVNESRRIIPNNMRKIIASHWRLLEIQPILGGQKLIIPISNVLEKVGD